MADEKVRAVVWKAEGPQPWRFRILARNNEIVAQSEGYVERQSAIDTAHLITDDVEVAESEPKTSAQTWDGEERLYAE